MTTPFPQQHCRRSGVLSSHQRWPQASHSASLCHHLHPCMRDQSSHPPENSTTSALHIGGRRCKSPYDRHKDRKNSKDRHEEAESKFSSLFHSLKMLWSLVFPTLPPLRDKSTGLGAVAGKDSFPNQAPGTRNHNNHHRHLKMLLYKTKENLFFWWQQALPALQRQSDVQYEYPAITVDEHLSPLTSVFKVPSALFAAIFLFSPSFQRGILANYTSHYISVYGRLYRVHSVLYMSCRVQFHLKTTLESTMSWGHHSAAHISPCRDD